VVIVVVVVPVDVGVLHAVLLRGDHELNEIKLKKRLGASEVTLAHEGLVQQATGAPVGFAGPVGALNVASIVADHAVAGLVDAVTGEMAGAAFSSRAQSVARLSEWQTATQRAAMARWEAARAQRRGEQPATD
jgi:prolyl-tRNA editing enzyme YbaK/EbsC (Cys-tRNA(Pro) deacylase)